MAMFDLDFAPYLNSISEDEKLIDANGRYVSVSVKIEIEGVLCADSYEALSSLHTCVKEKTQILLLGKPGYGKSTILTRFLSAIVKTCSSDKSHPIPVLLKLKDFLTKNEENEALTLNKLIIEQINSIDLTEKQVSQLLKDGRLCLLLDGLNEIPPNATRKQLKDFRKKYPNTQMIFSSREWDTETYLDIDCKLFIKQLTEKQAEDFSNITLGIDTTKKMFQSLQGRVKELVYTPLFLKMLCDTYKSETSPLSSQGELFRQFTEKQYNNHKSLEEDVEPHDKSFFANRHNILKILAVLMMDAGLKLDISTAAEKLSIKYFQKKSEEKLISWIKNARNLHLLQCTSGESSIEFPHQLFQEYYAAEWLRSCLDELSDEELCANYLNPIKWTESVLMAMDLISNKAQAERIINQALNVDVTLAAKLSGRVREEWQEDIFNILFLHLKEKQVNEYIITKIIRFNQTRYAAEHIIDFLDENKFISIHNISEGEWGKLFFTVSEIECEVTYKYACDIIDEKFPKIVSILINDGKIINLKFDGKETEFAGKKKLELTEKYIQKYGNSNFGISENPIIGSSSSIQWEAMLNLWRWGKYEDFLNKLHYFLWPRPLSESEHQYSEILYYSDMASKESLFNIIDFPSKYISSPRMDAKSQLAFNLLGEEGIYRKLSILRRASIAAIAKFMDDQIAEKLIALLDDKDLAVACFSAEKLGYLPELSVKEQAFVALLSVTKKAIISRNNDMETHISSDIYNSRQLFYNSTYALARLDKIRAGKELVDFLGTLNDSNKSMCIDALAMLNYEKAIPQLISLLKINRLPIKKSVVNALGIIGSKNEVQHLLQSLQDDVFEVKQNSIESLDKIIEKEVDEKTMSLIMESLFLELDSARGISEAIFKEYKHYQDIFNLPLGERDHSKIFSQECDTNRNQYAKYAQYINSILATLEHIATKYANHSICLRMIGYTLDAISTNKNVETRSLMLNLLGQIPHYNAIEEWLDNAKHDEKYISEWSELINKLSYGGSSWPIVYPSTYKYPQEMTCQFTSESEKNKFNLAVDSLETFHNQYRHFYRVGVGKTEGEHTSYASEFCKKENIESKFLEITNENSNKRNINNISSILNHCPNYWSRLIEWASHHDNELNKQLSILYGIHECKSEYIDDAFSLLENQQFKWKDILIKEIEKFPKCLGALSSRALHDYDFLRILRRSQYHHGYYSYEWFGNSKRIPKKLSGKNTETSAIYYITAQHIGHVGNTINAFNKVGETSMPSTFTFNAPFTAGVVGNNYGTVNMNTLDTQDIQELRDFLQAWKDHQQTQIIEDPENTGIEMAKALQHQKPALWEKLKYRLTNGGIGASTSLLGDLAVGEDPVKSAIKACFAFIGGAATSP
ncbi:HEAT repeat domain-containing protein [Thiothrix sp.]|jgi:HEAT repeat protein/energy-coupling factor transporter ATP-binding protein EcfA2|uniref:HEAT repeat domain-containing protein n=1 Tax=Thiothrix sp. TaxID=1032 RepID=UPI00257E3AC5|nr:HEAT repeat domain-containing protein [Thiothrix sp.]